MSEEAHVQPGAMPVPPSLPPAFGPTAPLPELSVAGGDPTVAGDEITIGGPSHTAPMSALADAPRRRRGLTLIASGLAVTLVAGVAVAAAWVWNGWGATLPEKALPASSLVFARVDLDPGLGPALTIKSLADKFPKTSDKSVVDEMTRGIVSDLGLDPLDYDRDIKAWFGGRLGFAYWMRGATDRSGCGLVALASKDEAKASSALSKVRDTKGDAAFGFAFHEGYAVTAACSDKKGSQSAAEAAVAEAKSGSLADNAAFSSAIDSLPSGQLAVGYADLNRVASALAEQLHAIAPTGGAGLSGGTESLTEGLKGQIIVGVKPTESGLDVRYRMRGGAAPGTNADALKELGALPGGTVLGVSADLRGTGDALGTGVLGGFGGLGGLDDVTGVDGVLTPGGAGSGQPSAIEPGDPCLQLDDDASPEEFAKCFEGLPGFDPNDPCFKLDEKSTPAEIENCFGDTPTFDPNDPCFKLDEKSTPAEIEKCVGPATPVDFSGLESGLKAIFRSAITAAFSSFGDSPQARLAITAASEADVTAIEALLGGSATTPLFEVTKSGTTVTAKTKDFAAGTGTLADGPRYQQALEGVAANSRVAFFLDVERLLPTLKLSDKERARLTPIKAVGGSFGYDGAEMVGLIRILIA